jgi:hypothetical protein
MNMWNEKVVLPFRNIMNMWNEKVVDRRDGWVDVSKKTCITWPCWQLHLGLWFSAP